MRSRYDDLRALGRTANFDDVCLLAVALGGAFERHLLGLRQQRFGATQVKEGVAGVGALDDAGDDVTLAIRILLELAVRFDFADALAHHLTEGHGGNAAHLFLARRVVTLIDPVAVFVDVIRNERKLQRLRVDFDDNFVGGIVAALVGRGQGVNEDVQERLFGEALLLGQHANCFTHVHIGHDVCVSFCVAVVFFFAACFLAGCFLASCFLPAFFGCCFGAPGFGPGPHSNIVRALSISSIMNVHSVPSSSSIVTFISSAAVNCPSIRRGSALGSRNRTVMSFPTSR